MKTIWIVLCVVVFVVFAGVAAIGALLFLRGSSTDDDVAGVDASEPEPAEVEETNDGEAPPEEGSDTDGDDGEQEIPGGEFDPVPEDTVAIEVADGSVEDFDGDIGPNGFDTFELDLVDGAEVVVTVQAVDASFDTLLRAVSPDGQQAAGNDDAEPSAGLQSIYDSQVSFVADGSGMYTIEVLSYDASATGDYVLTVDRTGNVVIAEQPNFAPAAVGGLGGSEDSVALTTAPNSTELVTASLEDPTKFDAFTVELEAGETISVMVEADPEGELDPLVMLVTEAGSVVAYNDDASGFDSSVAQPTDSQLDLRVVEAGEYAIEVTSFAGGTSGDYTLTLERSEGDGGGAPPVGELQDLPSSLFVESGETITVEGSVPDETLYDLILLDGDTVTITVESADPASFDPAVFLDFGSFGVGFNDDALDSDAVADQFDSQLVLTTANSGIHTIEVSGFGGSTGEFTMTVQRN